MKISTNNVGPDFCYVSLTILILSIYFSSFVSLFKFEFCVKNEMHVQCPFHSLGTGKVKESEIRKTNFYLQFVISFKHNIYHTILSEREQLSTFECTFNSELSPFCLPTVWQQKQHSYVPHRMQGNIWPEN